MSGPYNTHTTMTMRAADEQALFEADFFAPNPLPVLRDTGHCVIDFDTDRYPLHDRVVDMLVAKGLLKDSDRAAMGTLDNLHRFLVPEHMAVDHNELNEVTRQLYEQDDAFMEVYHAFLADVVHGHLLDDEFFFQATPTIRVNCPDGGGFAWKPRFHTDIMLSHPPQEINLWLPLTRAYGSNSMLLASQPDSMAVWRRFGLDFQAFANAVQSDRELTETCNQISRPVEMGFGSVMVFDSRCIHCTQINDTPHTRVSLDFRVIRRTDHDTLKLEYRGTGRRQMLFRKGHYYDDRSSSDLARERAAA